MKTEKQPLVFPTQKMSPIWNLLLVFPLLMTCYIFPVQQLIGGYFSVYSLIPVAFVLSAMALFYSIVLRVSISEDGIRYKMSPFHFRFKEIPKPDIKTMELVVFDALGEYGGWGIRWTGTTTAYILKSGWGMMVTKQSGKKVLIGIPKETEASALEALKQFGYPLPDAVPK